MENIQVYQRDIDIDIINDNWATNNNRNECNINSTCIRIVRVTRFLDVYV